MFVSSVKRQGAQVVVMVGKLMNVINVLGLLATSVLVWVIVTDARELFVWIAAQRTLRSRAVKVREISSLIFYVSSSSVLTSLFVLKCSGEPKCIEFNNAIGLAPIVKTSLKIPPTPVAAPWYGSI